MSRTLKLRGTRAWSSSIAQTDLGHAIREGDEINGDHRALLAAIRTQSGVELSEAVVALATRSQIASAHTTPNGETWFLLTQAAGGQAGPFDEEAGVALDEGGWLLMGQSQEPLEIVARVAGGQRAQIAVSNTVWLAAFWGPPINGAFELDIAPVGGTNVQRRRFEPPIPASDRRG